MNRSIKAQFKYADKIGAKKVVVIGSNELEKGEVKVKEMATGEEKLVTFDEIVK
jgi:histidyl-tRNA synthetase